MVTGTARRHAAYLWDSFLAMALSCFSMSSWSALTCIETVLYACYSDAAGLLPWSLPSSCSCHPLLLVYSPWSLPSSCSCHPLLLLFPHWSLPSGLLLLLNSCWSVPVCLHASGLAPLNPLPGNCHSLPACFCMHACLLKLLPACFCVHACVLKLLPAGLAYTGR